MVNRVPISASALRIYSPGDFERTRPTCKAEAFQVVANVAARDDRDERRNYQEGPVRDPKVGNEMRRRVSSGETCPGGRKGSARSARRPPMVVAHLIPSTDCTDAPEAQPSPVSATLRVDSETKPVTKRRILFSHLFLRPPSLSLYRLFLLNV